MADNSPAPVGYHSGAPTAPPSEPVDGQGRVNASVVPGYYSGGPSGIPGGGQGSAAPKESGFFASCCSCFSGGETAR